MSGKLEWRPISEAPYDTPVLIRLEDTRKITARLLRDNAMTTDEQPCDQWVAEEEGQHPACWTDGACWTVNADEVASLQPIEFARLTPPVMKEN